MMETISLTHSRFAYIGGLGILLAFALGAILAPAIAPYDPWVSDRPFAVPSPTHWLGTNDIGQDILSELIYGARVSLFVGFVAAAVSIAIGLVVGLVAGYLRGKTDEALMGLTDVFFMIPGLPLAILLAAYLGPGLWNIIFVIGLVSWPSTARVVRAQVLSLREMGYIEAARAMGAGALWNITRHIIPNISSIVVAKLALAIGSAMIAEASLSFLGLGDPASKSWGAILRYAFARGGFVQNLWWWYLPPGLCIGLCVLGFSLASFRFAEQGDPRLERLVSR
jgi:peptide/nickel transport system permease protein